MTEPTDAELPAEWDRVSHIADAGQRRLACLRAVLAKWGTPPAVAEWDRLRAAAIELRDAPDLRAMQRATAKLYAAIDTTPQPTQAQAGAVPLDEARRLFDAGWKAAALLCDREDVVADGIIGFGACPQFEAAFSAANGIKGGQHG